MKNEPVTIEDHRALRDAAEKRIKQLDEQIAKLADERDELRRIYGIAPHGIARG